MTAPGANSQPSLGEVIGLSTFLIGLISAWLYVTGWTYAYHYFDRFGIPLLMVDIPKEMYFVYGGVVLRQFSIIALAVVAVALVLSILWRCCGDGLARHGFGLASGRGQQPEWSQCYRSQHCFGSDVTPPSRSLTDNVLQRESDYGGYPRIQVWLKQDGKPPADAPNPSSDLASGCYRLLLHNQNRLFLLRSFKGAPAADLPVLILPWDQIEFTRVLPDYGSCN